MLDPLSAVSLASAIIQFVDFGSKIIVSGYETYRSTYGTTDENVDLEFLTQRLYRFQDQLSTPSKPLAQSDQELQDLARKSSYLAGDLLLLLDSLKVKEKGLIRTWDALRQSCRLVWKKDEIARKEKLLNSISGQINSRLLYMIREDTSSFSVHIRQLETTCDNLQVDLRADIRNAQDILSAKLDEQAASLKAIENRQTSQKEVESVGNRRTYYSSLQTIPEQIDHFAHVIDGVAKSHRVLQSLLFAEIESREEHIHEAYEKTFDWIFDDDKNDTDVTAAPARFERWLRSSNEVFWLNGKAGSGKSTLMKYLAGHRKTKTILREWAGDTQLVIAKHFFWNSGSKIQKSHIGLVQSLLYQILRQCPELIQFASIRRWESNEGFDSQTDVWTRTELASSFKNIMARGQLKSRFCFFIDGLDEYSDESAGEHYELIEYLDLLAQSAQVKLCVSSRPWTVFKDRYQGREDLTFVLQDLTSGDMYRYVEGMLQNDERFGRLVKREPQALDLVPQIRDKAEGVFLWVYLVVRSLLRGLAEHDDTTELKQRLSETPADLNEYFRKIFRSIEPIYQREAMRAFQLSTVALTLPLTAFKYIPNEIRNPRYAFELTVRQLQIPNEKARDRVNKWCRDLLEVKTNRSHDGKELPEEVHFLHRSVKDFLLTRDMQTHFNEYPTCQSSPRQAMCMMAFAAIKAMGPRQTREECLIFEERAVDLMLWALQCEIMERETPTEILDELGSMRTKVFAGWSSRERDIPVTKDNMVQFAAQQGLGLYVGQCLDRDPEAKVDILWYVVSWDPRLYNEVEDEIRAAVIAVQASARKFIRSTKTSWEVFLKACYESRVSHKYAKPWIEHGANLYIRFAAGLDVRTCLLTKEGYWHGLSKDETERQVDEWLADGRARRAEIAAVNESGSSSRQSLRSKFKRWLA